MRTFFMTMSDRYILDGTQPMPCADLLTWVRWMETADRHVAQTAVAPAVTVRTLFLGLDHNGTGRGCSILFQTMIFGGPLGGVWARYRTWSEAAQGHAAMCARVLAALGGAGFHPCPPGVSL